MSSTASILATTMPASQPPPGSLFMSTLDAAIANVQRLRALIATA